MSFSTEKTIWNEYLVTTTYTYDGSKYFQDMHVLTKCVDDALLLNEPTHWWKASSKLSSGVIVVMIVEGIESPSLNVGKSVF